MVIFVQVFLIPLRMLVMITVRSEFSVSLSTLPRDDCCLFFFDRNYGKPGTID